MWKNLPLEIVDYICEYSDYHVWRNGKYMKRIPVCDPRYTILNSMSKIHKSNHGTYDVCIWKHFPHGSKCSIIDCSLVNSRVLWNMTIAYYNSSVMIDYKQKWHYLE
jgi:hypothetical protein